MLNKNLWANRVVVFPGHFWRWGVTALSHICWPYLQCWSLPEFRSRAVLFMGISFIVRSFTQDNLHGGASTYKIDFCKIKILPVSITAILTFSHFYVLAFTKLSKTLMCMFACQPYKTNICCHICTPQCVIAHGCSKQITRETYKLFQFQFVAADRVLYGGWYWRKTVDAEQHTFLSYIYWF